MTSTKEPRTRLMARTVLVGALTLALAGAAGWAWHTTPTPAQQTPLALEVAVGSDQPGAPTGSVDGSLRLGPVTKSVGCVAALGRPDPACTPGAIDPRVTQASIRQTICVPGYSRSVRPPVTLTGQIKRERMAAYGLAGRPVSEVELDHLVPLSLGGHPSDVANLYPQPWHGSTGAHAKDQLEAEAHRAVCQGQLPLAQAQRRMAEDWLLLYAELLGMP